MKIENPFHYTYITEQVKNPLEFFKYFSSQILQEGVFKISQPMNHFILGAQGSGKTMFLRFFQYKNQSYIFNTNLIRFYKSTFGKKLPEKFAGIYYTVSLGPYTQFRGRNISHEKWAYLYGNYLNLVILEEITRLLSYCASGDGKKWASAMHIDVKEQSIIKAIKKLFESGYLPDELFYEHDYSNLSLFQQELIKKIGTYHQLISMLRVEENDLPNYQIEPGRLPIVFVEALRETKVLSKDIRLFILLDEYQELGMLSDNKLLPRIINSAIKLTARTPNSLIEYKVGTRRYGLKELRILGSETKIEKEREYDIIDLEKIFSGFVGIKAYREFIADITNKRLSKNDFFRVKEFNKWFHSIPARKKVLTYLKTKHNRNKLKKVIELKCSCTFSNFKKKYKKLFGEFPNDLYDRTVSMILFIQALEKYAITEENEIKYFINKKKRQGGWDKQTTEIILFTLATIYKKQRRYFGYTTLVNASKPIVLHYLRLCKIIFELAINDFELGKKVISINNQNSSFRIVSEDIFNEIATEKSSSGSKVQLMLFRIGSLFQDIHKNLFPSCLITDFQILTHEYKESTNNYLLDEAVDYSLLQRIDKKIDGQQVSRFIFNKILCPYFNLSVNPEDKYINFTKEDIDKLTSEDKKWNEVKERIIKIFEKKIKTNIRQLRLPFNIE